MSSKYASTVQVRLRRAFIVRLDEEDYYLLAPYKQHMMAPYKQITPASK